MQEPTSRAASQDNMIEQTIITLLAADAAVIWARDDLARETGDEMAATDAIRRLEAAGVIRQINAEFVLLGRAARRTIELMEGP